MTTIYDNNEAFGLMSAEKQAAMQAHADAGGIVSFFTGNSTWWSVSNPAFSVDSIYRAVRPAEKPMAVIAADLADALRSVLDRDIRNTCPHDETHRGGAIWEICDACGAKWADDEGGRPEWQDPQEWVNAWAVLDAYRASKSPR